MKTEIANSGAMRVRKMIKDREELRYIKAYAEGFGFDLNDTSSHVYIYKDGYVATKVRRNTEYDYITNYN